MLVLPLDGYFGHMYTDQDFFYVADASGLHCINISGQIIWQNNQLAVDGIVIEKCTASCIYGSGECDPPGGWQSFILNKYTGQTHTIID